MFFYVPIAAPQRQGVDELETMCIRTHIDLAYAATVCRMPVCAKFAQNHSEKSIFTREPPQGPHRPP